MSKKIYDEEIGNDVDWGGDSSTGGLPVSGRRVQENIKKRFKALNDSNQVILESIATEIHERETSITNTVSGYKAAVKKVEVELEKEKEERIYADDTLTLNLTKEINARKSEGESLRTSISNETTERASAISDVKSVFKTATDRLNTTLEKEIEDRSAQTDMLTKNLSKETASRKEEGESLRTSISNETTERKEETANLKSKIAKETADREAAILEEVEARTSIENALDSLRSMLTTTMTEKEYDALPKKESNRVYLITEE